MCYRALAVLVVFGVIREADCSTYHVAFLGRTFPSASAEFGYLHFTTSGSAPTVRSAVSSCTNAIINTTLRVHTMTLTASECSGLIPNGIEVAKKAIKVESSDDLILHVYEAEPTDSPGLSDGYLAIPDEHLGNEYYIVTYCSMGGLCQFAVAGVADDTSVKIIFPYNSSIDVIVNGQVSQPGAVVPVTLHENDVLHIESEADLSGTYITSDNNVSVFVGARDVPTAAGNSAYMIEQIPPVNKWGTTFIVIPNYLNEAGDIVKIVTKTDNTDIHILGFSPFRIPTKGESVERRIDWEMHSSIEASSPIVVVQIMSTDLYNDTTDGVVGSPVMVLVSHVEQWTSSDSVFMCSNMTNTLVAMAVYTGSTSVSNALSFYSMTNTWSAIDGTVYSVMILKQLDTYILSGDKRGAYGYCYGKAAVLVGADWTWENEDCTMTAPIPGDNRDNDCDGKIDEDACTTDDLSIQFTCNQSTNGHLAFKNVTVRGASNAYFTIQTCDIAMVVLVTDTEPRHSFTAWITPTVVTVQACTPDCQEASKTTNTVPDCNDTYSYAIVWTIASSSTHYTIMNQASESVTVTANANIYYDKMFFASFVGTAQFDIKIPEKDCAKMIEDDADNFGRKFTVPVSNENYAYRISITSKTTTMISFSVSVAYSQVVVNAMETVSISSPDVLQATYKMITIYAYNGEISVYLRRAVSQYVISSLCIIPTDVLGTSYHLFLDSTIDTADPTGTVLVCEAYTTYDNTETNAGTFSDRLYITFEMYNELGSKHLLTSNRPISVFCGTLGDTLVQIPPRETLGTMFYTPKLRLDTLDATAVIRLVATEDSVVVIIKGNYDQLDTINLTGDTHFRTVESNKIYSINSSKPIQVHLELRSKSAEPDGWAIVAVIPPVQQYKDTHILPAHGLSGLLPAGITAVDKDGNGITTDLTPLVSAAMTITYNTDTFSLTVINYALSTIDAFYIVLSDVNYLDLNLICVITDGLPGDEVDNDCDGLVDEEQCSIDTIAGNVDFDIDGSINEDCAANTTGSTSKIQLSIPAAIVTTSSGAGNGSGDANEDSDTSGTITIDNNLVSVTVTDNNGQPDLSPNGTDVTFEPLSATVLTIVSTGPTATTTAGPNPTPAADETCLTDCVCPCSWVNPPKNYTPEELAAVVVEIQEKLTVTKSQLSSTIRTKISASDNRPSATALGFVGLLFMVITLGSMLLLDITTIMKDIRLMISNLQQVFQP